MLSENYMIQDLRLNGHRSIALGTRWRIIDRGHLSVDVAVQFVVQIEVTLVLQRRSASGALEAVHMQVLVLYADKYTAGYVGRW